MTSPQKIIVFGKSGQLGSALHQLSTTQSTFEIIVMGRPEADLTNYQQIAAILEREQPAGIINAAAYTAVDDAESDEGRAFELNSVAPHWLAQCAKGHNIPLIHISTDYVFNGTKETAYTPEDDIAPINAYGRSKLAGEWSTLATHPSMTYVVRTSWVYSEWGSNFVKTMLKLGETRDVLAVVDDQVGSPTYVVDLAEACLTMMQSILAGTVDSPGIYHYSNAGTCSWHEFAEEIFKSSENMTVNKTTSDQFPRPAQRPQFSKLDSTKLEQTFNLSTRDWKEALNSCLAKLT